MLLINLLLALAILAKATTLSIKTPAQQKQTAQLLARNLMGYYTSTDGLLPYPPYFAWESAGLWSTMIGYTIHTSDKQYLTKITTGIATQAGASLDFMGANTPGNDDQLWWGLAAMSAAEARLPLPTSPAIGSWEKLATNVFDKVIARWDNTTCGGGLHWQISPSASGYSYKNSITNSLALQLAVRLANHTKQQKYTIWAERIWNWILAVNLIDKDTHVVYDGTDSKNNCSDLNHDLWSYNTAVPMYAVSLLYQHHPAKYKDQLAGFINATRSAFTGNNTNILVEKCEATGNCNADQLSFKAYMVRSLAEVAARVPWTRKEVMPILKASVQGAVEGCDGASGGCGMSWMKGLSDGVVGVGQQMSVLEEVVGLGVVQRAVDKEKKKQHGGGKGYGRGHGGQRAGD